MTYRVLVAAFVACAAFLLIPGRARAADDAPALSAMLPDSPGFFNVQLKATVAGKPLNIPCRLFIPRGYDKTKDAWPLLVFLHGDEERGTDLAALATVGPERRLREDQGFRDACRLICASPQCPPGLTWDDPAMAGVVTSLVDELAKAFRVDAERVGLTGTGSGAALAWRAAYASPDRFAAVAVNSGKAVQLDNLGPKLRHVYAHVSASQGDAPSYAAYGQMIETLGKAKAEVTFRTLGGSPKESAQQFYNDNGTYDFFYNHKRRTPKEREDRDAQLALGDKAIAEQIAKLPKTAGDYRLVYETWVGEKKIQVPYLLVLPKGYEADPSRKWPVLIFLHGGGEGNPDMTGMYVHGPAAHLRESQQFRDWFPFILLCPVHDNAPERARAVVEVLDDVEKHYRCDPDRAYVTGLSLGGTSTWTVALAGPDRFAAIAPISARARTPEVAAERLKYLSTWIISGTDDGDFTVGSRQMYEAMSKTCADVSWSNIRGEGHGCWGRYYPDQRFYEWLLQHRRLTPAQRAERDKADRGAPPSRPGQYRLEFATQIGGKPYAMRYGLYLPPGYDAAPTAPRVPMTVFLHHDDDRGTDKACVFDWGNGIDTRKDEKSRAPFPMVGLSPQCPQDKQWNDPEVLKAVADLCDFVATKFHVDADRVYATGFQSGGAAVWQLALNDPKRFAGVCPFQAGAVKPDEVAAKLKYGAARLLAAANDGGQVSAARQMIDALRRARAEARLTLLPRSEDPATWFPYYAEPGLTSWLLAHRRPSDAERKALDDREARLAAFPYPKAPGEHHLTFETMTADRPPISFEYRVYLPKNYDKTQERMPMVLFLHGANMPATQPADGNWGPDLALFSNAKLGDAYQVIGLCPQCPAGRRWDEPGMSQALVALALDARQRFRVDADRVYAAGAEAGGTAACRVAMDAPDLFAAIAPAAPAIGPADVGSRLRGVAACVVGADEDILGADAARKLAEALRQAQSEAELMLVPGTGAARWQTYFAEPRFYDWLLRHRRAH